MRDIDHDIAGTDDGHMLAHFKWTVAESRQPVEVIDHVFRMEDAFGRIPLHADRFRALSADWKHDRARSERADVFHRQIFALADRDVPKIVDVGLLEKLPILLPQSSAQLELGGKDAVFG